MEFLLYLNPQGQQLLRELTAARINVRENIALCRNPNAFGQYIEPNNIVICTKNIKKSGYNVKYHVNETLFHEAVHVAQFCSGRSTIGLSKSKMPLSRNKLKDVQESVRITNNVLAGHAEHEAYYLEDKPKQVIKYVSKFCF